jgi:23S rRNA pseudouridine2605 synthase
MSSERVQKILAQAGIASRRQAEELIRDGLVTINGRVAKLGDKAEWGSDAIKVKGKLLRQVESPVYLAFNKPRAVISMLGDPEGRPSLTDFLKKVKSRVFPVGRLDFNSEGLILLTNDGDLAEKIQKRDDIPRVYWVKIKGHPDAEMISRLERGARLGERKRLVKPHSVRVKESLSSKAVIEVVMLGAGAFDIKALFEARGFLVDRITRTAIGQITLRGLPAGHFRYLKLSQVQALLDQPELALVQLEREAKAAREVQEAREARQTKLASLRKQTPIQAKKPIGKLTGKPSEKSSFGRPTRTGKPSPIRPARPTQKRR